MVSAEAPTDQVPATTTVRAHRLIFHPPLDSEEVGLLRHTVFAEDGPHGNAFPSGDRSVIYIPLNPLEVSAADLESPPYDEDEEGAPEAETTLPIDEQAETELEAEDQQAKAVKLRSVRQAERAAMSSVANAVAAATGRTQIRFGWKFDYLVLGLSTPFPSEGVDDDEVEAFRAASGINLAKPKNNADETVSYVSAGGGAGQHTSRRGARSANTRMGKLREEVHSRLLPYMGRALINDDIVVLGGNERDLSLFNKHGN